MVRNITKTIQVFLKDAGVEKVKDIALEQIHVLQTANFAWFHLAIFLWNCNFKNRNSYFNQLQKILC